MTSPTFLSSPAFLSSPVLIAADQPVEALALETVLRDAGYPHVRVTCDGREIIPLHDKWPFQLLVLDMSLRTHSSLDVLEQLATRIDGGHVAVLALTTAGDAASQDHALGLGAADILTRPFTRAEILMRVSDALARLPGASVDDVVLRAVSKRFAPML